MLNVAIAGAGIGGLTTALCLHEYGFAVQVFEAVDQIRPLGVGLNLMPHASAVLHGLGLGPALDETAIRTRCIEYRTRYGHLLQSDPRNVDAGYEAPQYSIHRGACQLLLLNAVQRRLGAAVIKTGKRLERFTQTTDKATAHFTDGSEYACDILIGADGLRSNVRRQLHPDEGALHYEGTMMYRGATETDLVGDGKTMVIAGDHDLKFVTYPVSESARKLGRSLTNWVAEVRVDQPRHLQDADWTREGERDFIDAFGDFTLDALDIVKLMHQTESVTEFPMIDRDPIGCWTDHRVTLLGDAAHPMYPIGANGASQAIMDARQLAKSLESSPGPAGLQAYESLRRPATSRIVLSNRQSGPEKVLDIAAARLSGPNDRVEDLVTPEELESVAAHYREIAGFTRSMS